MKRKKPQDYVVGEPAVFLPVVGSPEFGAECQELEKFKLTADEPFRYDVLRLRKMRKEGEERDQKHYGDRYPEILRIRATIQSDVFEWIKPMAQDARLRGFPFFRCNWRRDGLQLQFADGNGAYFQRSLGLDRFANKYGLSLGVGDYLRLSSAVDGYVRGLDGMGMLDHGMTSRRVSVNG